MKDIATVAPGELKSQWCLIGSIRPMAGRPHPHFSAGTKVHCLPPVWGDGYDKIIAIGRHRSSARVVELVVDSDFVTAWRAKVVYSPAVLKLLAAHRNGWDGPSQIEAFIASIQRSR